VVGPPLWNSAFLPGVYQGTHIVNHETDPNKVIPFFHKSQVARPRRPRSSISANRAQRRTLYGDGDFARGCLMARRLVEHGVRWCASTLAIFSPGTITTTS
jgi:hypothetical protein